MRAHFAYATSAAELLELYSPDPLLLLAFCVMATASYALAGAAESAGLPRVTGCVRSLACHG